MFKYFRVLWQPARVYICHVYIIHFERPILKKHVLPKRRQHVDFISFRSEGTAPAAPAVSGSSVDPAEGAPGTGLSLVDWTSACSVDSVRDFSLDALRLLSTMVAMS